MRKYPDGLIEKEGGKSVESYDFEGEFDGVDVSLWCCSGLYGIVNSSENRNIYLARKHISRINRKSTLFGPCADPLGALFTRMLYMARSLGYFHVCDLH